MANTLTSVTETMVQDEVLPALKLGLLPIEAFSYEVANDWKGVGDVVRVPVATARTAGTFNANWETGDSTVATTAVTLAAPTFASWYVDPYLEGMPTMERFLAQGKEAAYSVAKLVMQDIIDEFIAANVGDVAGTDKLVVTAANYDTDDQADLWKLLSNKGVKGAISAIHTISYAAALRKDAALKDQSASGSDILQTGQFPPIIGVKQYFTDAFSSTITGENTEVIYTGKETAAVGFASPDPAILDSENQAGVRTITVSDPDTGIPLTWRTWTNSATGKFWGAVYVMKGEAFIQDAAVRIVSA